MDTEPIKRWRDSRPARLLQSRNNNCQDQLDKKYEYLVSSTMQVIPPNTSTNLEPCVREFFRGIDLAPHGSFSLCSLLSMTPELHNSP